MDIKKIWNNSVVVNLREAFYTRQMPEYCDHCQFVQNGSLKRIRVFER
jgi:hypothetical protein